MKRQSVCQSELPESLRYARACKLRLWRCRERRQRLSCSSSTVILPASGIVSGSFWFPFSRSGNRNWFLNGRKELPSRSFSSCFLHAATVGGRGVCVAQTCTDARSAHKTAHIGTTRPTPRSKRLRRCAFPTCAIVQPLVLRLQAALGVRVLPASCVLVPKCYPKPPPTKRIRKWFLLVNTGMLAKRPAFRHGGKPSKSAAISAPRKLLRGGRIALILQVFPMDL